MNKIVSNVLIVSTQLIVGGLFLFMLFSDNNEGNRVVVVENNNLDKMADAVSELFVVDHAVVEDEAKKQQEEEELKAAEEQRRLEEEAKAREEEAARLAQEEAKRQQEAEEAARKAATVNRVDSLQSYARDLVINTYGWSESDFEALVLLWNIESGWSYCASNGSAYGIPQALPGSRMASEGSDYLTNGETQIRWGLKYIKSTYGSPSMAWSHFQEKKWY